MGMKDGDRQRRHAKAVARRAAKARDRSQRRSEEARPSRRAASPAMMQASNPLAFNSPYENGRTVFGEAVPADLLVDRIKTFNWREALIRLGHLASVLANDDAGLRAERAVRLTAAGINALTAFTPQARALLQRGRAYVAKANQPLVVAHEEAVVFLEHLVLLYGADGGNGPSDAELAFWLLAASDHLETWNEADTRSLDDTEGLAAELVKVFRFNRSSVDEVRLLSRAHGIFNTPPAEGTFATPGAWASLQESAFGDDFTHYFECFAIPLIMLSYGWGKHADIKRAMPVLVPDHLRKDFGAEGDYFVTHLADLTCTRDEARAEILRRMRPDGRLPHAPTALLRKPFVDLQNGGEIVAASPWYVRAIGRTGIWAKYLAGAKTQLGNTRGGDEWSIAFGQMLEGWCRRYAKRAEASARTPFTVELPTRPGAADEIEDVVTVEDAGVTMFSVKARLVREDVARHAISRSKLLDWYEEFFFKERTVKFRAGVIAQLSARIGKVREGKFEPRVRRDARVFPVLVTYDNLCDNKMLSAWLNGRCKAHGLLQQVDVAPLTIAVVDDYERLLAAPFQKKSVAEILSSRSSPRLKDERLEVVLYGHEVEPRLPGTDTEYEELIGRVVAKLEGRKARGSKQALRLI
jgi:hypothetical protein